MSAFGTKRTFKGAQLMSAFGGRDVWKICGLAGRLVTEDIGFSDGAFSAFPAWRVGADEVIE
jgi:hypothetical protein